MSSHNDHPVDENLLEEMGYEHADVDFKTTSKSIFWFFVVSTVLMAAGLGTMWLLAPKMTFQAPKEKLEDRARKPGQEQPLIQSNATALRDMKEFMKSEEVSVASYGWSDRKSGYVHIPIDEAMKKVLAKGLPVRPNPVDPEAGQ